MLPNPWMITRQNSINAALRDGGEDEEAFLPVYQPPVGKSKFIHPKPPLTTSNPSMSFLQMDTQETVTYTYSLHAGSAPLLFTILVEPVAGQPNHYIFSLSMKAGHIERSLCSPATLRLSVDPRQLDFSVFIFPPRMSLPAGCLFNLRVWLRTAGTDHRLFSDNELWVGRDPDFRSVGDASFAVLRNAMEDMLIYQSIVGQAHVTFIIKWELVEVGLYSLSMEYEAGGAGRTLFDSCYLRLECDPQIVTFMIYTIPISSTPAGASHRLRVWLRTPFSTPSPASSTTSHSGDSYIYHRVWKSDDFKLGAGLNFGTLGSKLVMGIRDPDSPQVGNHPRLWPRRSQPPENVTGT